MIKFCTFLIFLLLVVTSVMLVVTKNRFKDNVQTNEVQGEGVALIGGDFTLINQDGVAVSNKDFRGKVMMVFFGFTHCPDMCPTTASSFTKILESLGNKANSIAPIFISVDPERDTSAVLKEYLSNFDKRIIGLTGTKEQIKTVASVYKAYFAQSKTAEGDESVDHSGFIYIMDKNGAYVQHFPYDASVQDITSSISGLLK